MCSHNSTASCQSTSPKRTPSRNPAASLRTLRGLSVSALSLLFAMRVQYSTGTTLAPAPGIYNSRDAPWLCAGWPAPMIRPLIAILQFILGLSFVAAAFPHALRAQLVPENSSPPQQKVSPKQDLQNSPSAQAPPGKKRLSQEVQLTGEQSWVDTTIDIQAGEHALITAAGKLRYADAKDDNGPDGLPRGFRDLLRILPFNEAGRGALIGRIGDKDTTQPFVIGARRDVIAPVSGRLSVGINQTTDDTGDGNYAVRSPDKSTRFPASITISSPRSRAASATKKATPATWLISWCLALKPPCSTFSLPLAGSRLTPTSGTLFSMASSAAFQKNPT